MALVTIACTAMIYASLKPIRQWHNAFVLPNYLLIALYTGAVWLAAVTSFWHDAAARVPGAAAIVFGLIAIAAKLAYWRAIDRTRRQHHRERDRPRRASAASACWRRRTPRRIISCARWASRSRASTRIGCAC